MAPKNLTAATFHRTGWRMLRGLLIAVVVIFHLVMLVDCIGRQPTYFAGSSSRVAWILAIILIPVLGPLAYMVVMLGKPGPVS